MRRALFAKALRDSSLLLAALFVLLFCFAWLQIWVLSKVESSVFADFLARALPKNWEKIAGISFSEMATAAGRAALTYSHALVLLGALVWTIGRGSDCVSGEIGRGTMELILAQPIPRSTVYATQALAVVIGNLLLALAVWGGIAVGIATVPLSEKLSASQFIPPTANLFGLMTCLSGLSALASAAGSQRWRSIAMVAVAYVAAIIFAVVGRLADGWHWLNYCSFLTAYSPSGMVAQPDKAWVIFDYHGGHFVGFGFGSEQLVLFGLGLLCYLAGAAVFSRREIPAPI
jgi:ABC-2 type transport system permease protein